MKYKEQYFRIEGYYVYLFPCPLSKVRGLIRACRWYRDSEGTVVVTSIPNVGPYLRKVGKK